MEFYDEELSRTFRQIQQLFIDNEEDEKQRNPDKLFISCGAYLQQMTREVKLMKRGEEKKQWTEIIKFRKDAFKHLQNQG